MRLSTNRTANLRGETWKSPQNSQPKARWRRKRSPTLQAWTNMLMRCTNKNRPDFKYYGGRGIKVCKRWRSSFANFLSDMGERPVGRSLDTKNNNKGYSPKNCRWATKDEQMQNTRATSAITLGRKTMGLNAWARSLGITHSSLQGRFARGWPLEKALTMGRTK